VRLELTKAEGTDWIPVGRSGAEPPRKGQLRLFD